MTMRHISGEDFIKLVLRGEKKFQDCEIFHLKAKNLILEDMDFSFARLQSWDLENSRVVANFNNSDLDRVNISGDDGMFIGKFQEGAIWNSHLRSAQVKCEGVIIESSAFAQITNSAFPSSVVCHTLFSDVSGVNFSHTTFDDVIFNTELNIENLAFREVTVLGCGVEIAGGTNIRAEGPECINSVLQLCEKRKGGETLTQDELDKLRIPTAYRTLLLTVEPKSEQWEEWVNFLRFLSEQG